LDLICLLALLEVGAGQGRFDSTLAARHVTDLTNHLTPLEATIIIGCLGGRLALAILSMRVEALERGENKPIIWSSHLVLVENPLLQAPAPTASTLVRPLS
jgi:hypothetical protein